jgi:hypothetical protein
MSLKGHIEGGVWGIYFGEEELGGGGLQRTANGQVDKERITMTPKERKNFQEAAS